MMEQLEKRTDSIASTIPSQRSSSDEEQRIVYSSSIESVTSVRNAYLGSLNDQDEPFTQISDDEFKY